MRQDLQEILYTEFPKIFRERHLPCTKTAMCWGIECPDTWFRIIHTLCWTIQRIIDSDNTIPQVEAVQVKEKFGTLRFYYRGGNAKIRELIHTAKNLNETICAECGSKEDVKPTKGWITYLCKNCREERKKCTCGE